MSTITDIEKVDAIGIDKDDKTVTLKIFDHLSWENEAEHLYLLQDKINKYLAFIESGEILASYPKAENKNITISIDILHNPTKNGIKFLDTSSRIIRDAGFSLEYIVEA